MLPALQVSRLYLLVSPRSNLATAPQPQLHFPTIHLLSTSSFDLSNMNKFYCVTVLLCAVLTQVTGIPQVPLLGGAGASRYAHAQAPLYNAMYAGAVQHAAVPQANQATGGLNRMPSKVPFYVPTTTRGTSYGSFSGAGCSETWAAYYFWWVVTDVKTTCKRAGPDGFCCVVLSVFDDTFFRATHRYEFKLAEGESKTYSGQWSGDNYKVCGCISDQDGSVEVW